MCVHCLPISKYKQKRTLRMIKQAILMAYLRRVSDSMWQLNCRYYLDFFGSRDSLNKQRVNKMAPMKRPTLAIPTTKLRIQVRMSRIERSINSDMGSITNMLYLQILSIHSNLTVPKMNLIMLEEQRSFENKMDNINQTNQLLDELQRKMNSYFNQNSSAKSSHPILLADEEQFKRQSIPANKFQIYNQLQPRVSQSTVQNKPKKSDSFRLFGKPKPKNQPTYQQSNIEIQHRQKEPWNIKDQIIEPRIEEDSPKLRFKHDDTSPMTAEQLKRKDQQFPQARTRNNSLVREMETMQILMKEKMLAKERRIRQLQQQIITQNQERVYLYKVNVRLEEQLKFLKETPKQNDRYQWQICKMKDQIERLKKQLEKKKKQKKQLKRQEQTLKDGYRTIIQNRRDITMKELEKYTQSQKQSKQSYNMLKSLMQELDKLKGVVEEKIKSKSRRKVIKSFKY